MLCVEFDFLIIEEPYKFTYLPIASICLKKVFNAKKSINLDYDIQSVIKKNCIV